MQNHSNYRLVILFTISLVFQGVIVGQDIKRCRAILKNDTLTLETGKVFEKYKWNSGNLIRLEFGLSKTGKSILKADKKPVFEMNQLYSEGKLTVSKHEATPKKQAFLKVEVLCEDKEVKIKRVFHLFPGCPAIECDYYFRGNAVGHPVFKSGTNEITVDRFVFNGVHWYGKAIEFFDGTDRNNTLVRESNLLSYAFPKTEYPGIKHEFQLRGNLLLLQNLETLDQMFVLKEAPCSSVQLNYPGYDFTLIKGGESKVTGIGLTDKDINDSTWTKAYGNVAGISETNDELGILTALREYQKTVRIFRPERDEMIMINTWGDMSKDARVNEEFALKELEAGKKLGATHFQLDDGWQNGRSANSAYSGGSFENIWKDSLYWQPHPERFPNGLEKVVNKGKELGIQIGLWFNPDPTNNYANWEKDAKIIIDLYRMYDIKTFKIDGVNIPTKLAEINYRRFLDRISMATNYDVIFNLDVTAGKRGGYLFFNEYGNLFVENRFTDWHDYFPYTTLRNVWMLSKYVPLQNLQIEFLNNSRNAAKYQNDPFAPQNYSFDYVFAISMAAQPLAWFEVTGLSTDMLNTGSQVIGSYRKIMHDFHEGIILPIGNEPNGRSWTGFQSIGQDGGYFIVYRELNENSKAELKTWLKKGSKVELIALFGSGKTKQIRVDDDGVIEFELPQKNSFACYRYNVK